MEDSRAPIASSIQKEHGTRWHTSLTAEESPMHRIRRMGLFSIDMIRNHEIIRDFYFRASQPRDSTAHALCRMSSCCRSSPPSPCGSSDRHGARRRKMQLLRMHRRYRLPYKSLPLVADIKIQALCQSDTQEAKQTMQSQTYRRQRTQPTSTRLSPS